MDLLHGGRFSGFVLVSSDSDFTRLASRIREQGADVFGIGKETTPDAFRKACKRFIFIENLLANPDEEPADTGQPQTGPTTGKSGTGTDRKADTKPHGEPTPKQAPPRLAEASRSAEPMRKQPPSKAVPLITAAMRSHDEDWVPLSVIGSHIHAANPDFDARTYGCPKLADLLEKTGQFEVRRDRTPVVARQKEVAVNSHIRSTVSIPSRPSPVFSVSAVKAHSLRRLSRSGPGASRTGHVS